jgi:hypothetical protein
LFIFTQFVLVFSWPFSGLCTPCAFATIEYNFVDSKKKKVSRTWLPHNNVISEFWWNLI